MFDGHDVLLYSVLFFFFKQKTEYELRISDWSSDVCSSDLVAALYRFASFDDPAALRQPLLDLCTAHGIKGTLLLAREGINGTIAGTADGIAAAITHIRALPDCAELDVKYSTAADMPFQRMKVRLKKEIVTLKEIGRAHV